jgi:L-galactose dehydrogenase/L-glyceraldehyde 3-phosphate reductase
MKYRDFGRTGIKVSELVFGGGAVGGLLINQDDETKQEAIQRAMEAGINWIDTAPSYGQGRSEESLGWLLKQVDADPYVSTKFVIDTRDLNDIPGQIESSLEASLKRLKRDSVTLLQMHNWIGQETKGRIIAVAELLKKGGVFDTLQRMKEQGPILHFGITALGETPSIIKVIESGRIESAQVYYNLLNPSAGMNIPQAWEVYSFSGILDACEKHGVAAMDIRVFSAGVIATDSRTGRERPLTPGDTVESEEIKAKAVFDEMGTDHGTRAQTAIRFALAQQKLACVIFGLAEIDHLEEAIAAQDMGSLPKEGLKRLNEVYEKGASRSMK